MPIKWTTWKKWTNSYKSKLYKTEPGRNIKSEQTHHNHGNQNCNQISSNNNNNNNNKEIFQQTKAQDQMASQLNSAKNLEKS